MKLAAFLKVWEPSELEPNLPKLGINWWMIAGKPRDRFGVDLIHPWGRVDLVLTTNSVRYEKDLGPYRGWRIL